ncbi:hypothetical protein EVAR_42534_1 [Eumeta japonica]|uniref:Uncharacterized protein n=1 Tax=Eumeta variegata TaxID=151549 RepID=A0A4C1WQP8_EUMVA|nr:hypothetical protein EVAR_42534_1 [Eumeta japonica]
MSARACILARACVCDRAWGVYITPLSQIHSGGVAAPHFDSKGMELKRRRADFRWLASINSVEIADALEFTRLQTGLTKISSDSERESRIDPLRPRKSIGKSTPQLVAKRHPTEGSLKRTMESLDKAGAPKKVEYQNKTINQAGTYQRPYLAIYPENTKETITVEETKKIVKAFVNPTQLQIQVDRVRKIGNAGIIVQTRSMNNANRIKECPDIEKAGLEVIDRRQRRPLVKFSDINEDVGRWTCLDGVAKNCTNTKTRYGSCVGTLSNRGRLLYAALVISGGCDGAKRNVHSPLWHSDARHNIGKGFKAKERRAQLQGFIGQHHFQVKNVKGQLYTFLVPTGALSDNVDDAIKTMLNAVIPDEDINKDEARHRKSGSRQ